MHLTFLGAARTVTGSMHLVEANGQRILLDCGLFQGRRAEAARRNLNLPFERHCVNAVILSHAHIDHSGNLPTLTRGGFVGEIVCTAATRDLVSIMLRDSAHIQEKDTEFVNKIRARHSEPSVEPLYTLADAEQSIQYLVGRSYNRWFELTDGVRAIFYDAGHILGSAISVLELNENGRTIRLGFSGDLGRRGMPILRDPNVISDVDCLIVESTYGDRRHGPLTEAEDKLAEVVNATYARRGKVIIPALAVGRTQEIVYALHRLLHAGRIPALPVFVDSPLAVDATEIFRLHPECFDAETQSFLRQDDPFGFRQLHYFRDVEDSMRLNTWDEPMIIISASGMCEAGRILHHLKHNVGDPRNTILLVSFQAAHTLGRKLADGWEKVRIFGEEYTVRARVERIDGLSAHADREDLLWWIGQAKGYLKKVFVVHGEESQSLALADGIRALGVPEVMVPEPGEQVVI